MSAGTKKKRGGNESHDESRDKLKTVKILQREKIGKDFIYGILFRNLREGL